MEVPMEVHRLVIFWRDKQARSFTLLHVLPGIDKTAHQSALLMLIAFAKLSKLQIYAAVFDSEPIHLDKLKPAPAEAMSTSLEISLRPEKRMSSKNGPLNLSIPAPKSQLASEVEDGICSSRLWSIIKKQILPYLCSPQGRKVSNTANPILSASISLLYYEYRPQPGKPPLDPAISQTQRELESIKSCYKDFPTTENLQSIEEYSHRLEQLQKWQQIEASAFSSLQKTIISIKNNS